MSLEGRIALVTGAGRGIGRAIATELAESGARVVIGDIDGSASDKLANELASAGYEVFPASSDVAKQEDAEALVTTAIDRYGTLDILVNNAGINRDSMLHKMTNDQWRAVLDVDLTAVFFTTRCAARHMREKRYGRIINISSASWLGSLGQANYAAAKAGVVGLTLTAARELAPRGVTANAICPGFIDTEMTRSVPSNVWQQVVDRIPAGRPGSPKDVASLVGFLASEAAGYITGQVLNVSGGLVW